MSDLGRLASTVADLDRELEATGSLERIYDEAGVLGPLQQALGLLAIRTRRYPQTHAGQELRELCHALDTVEDALGFATEGRPGELRGPRHGTEGENETIGDRGDEQCLRRPSVTRTAEVDGWSRDQRGQPLALERDVALLIRDRLNRVSMRKQGWFGGLALELGHATLLVRDELR
jgi:hypothetical protein